MDRSQKPLRKSDTMPTLNDILLIAASQGFLLCAVILSQRSGNPPASRLLAAFVGLESLHLLLLHMYSEAGQPPLALLRLLFCLRLLDGPVLYLYVRALTEPGFRLRRGEVVHAWVLLPALAWFGYLVMRPDWLLYSTAELQRMPSTIAISLCQSMIVFAYGLVARQRLAAHEVRLKQVLSAMESLSLRWLRWLVIALVAVAVLHIALDLLRLLIQLDASVKYFVNLTVTVLLIYLISLGGLRQPQVYTQPVRDALLAVANAADPPTVSMHEAEGTERARYRKSGLDETRSAVIARRLKEQLEHERCYMDSTLDLPGLARRLSVRPQELSEVISTVFGSTFYELVNHARVEAAKTLLLEPRAQRRKMLDIAMSVGFSSQSTFYSQFKRVTGKTPVAYRDHWYGQAAGKVPEA